MEAALVTALDCSTVQQCSCESPGRAGVAKQGYIAATRAACCVNVAGVGRQPRSSAAYLFRCCLHIFPARMRERERVHSRLKRIYVLVPRSARRRVWTRSDVNRQASSCNTDQVAQLERTLSVARSDRTGEPIHLHVNNRMAEYGGWAQHVRSCRAPLRQGCHPCPTSALSHNFRRIFQSDKVMNMMNL